VLSTTQALTAVVKPCTLPTVSWAWLQYRHADGATLRQPEHRLWRTVTQFKAIL